MPFMLLLSCPNYARAILFHRKAGENQKKLHIFRHSRAGDYDVYEAEATCLLLQQRMRVFTPHLRHSRASGNDENRNKNYAGGQHE
jgi:hypothetical protein